MRPAALLMTRHACLAACTAILTLASCASEAPAPVIPAAAATPVTLVEPGLLLDPEPLVQIGGAGDEGIPGHDLHIVEGARFVGGNLIAVANSGSQTVPYFTLDGSLLRTAGRAGEGPGEFRNLRSIDRWGGDIAAWDGRQARITIFDPSGNTARTIPVKLERTSEAGRATTPMDVYALGGERFVVIGGEVRRRIPEGLSREPRYVAILDPAGAPAARVGLLEGHEWFNGSGGAMSAPRGYRFYAATTPGAVWIGNGRGPELTGYDTEGEVVRVLRLPIEREYVTPRQREQARDDYVAQFRPIMQQKALEEYDEAPAVDSFPAFTDLVGGAQCLWVELHTSVPDLSAWLVVDPVDAVARRVTLAGEAVVLDAVGDRAAFLVQDDMQREEIRVHRVSVPDSASFCR